MISTECSRRGTMRHLNTSKSFSPQQNLRYRKLEKIRLQEELLLMSFRQLDLEGRMFLLRVADLAASKSAPDPGAKLPPHTVQNYSLQ